MTNPEIKPGDVVRTKPMKAVAVVPVKNDAEVMVQIDKGPTTWIRAAFLERLPAASDDVVERVAGALHIYAAEQLDEMTTWEKAFTAITRPVKETENV